MKKLITLLFILSLFSCYPDFVRVSDLIFFNASSEVDNVSLIVRDIPGSIQVIGSNNTDDIILRYTVSIDGVETAIVNTVLPNNLFSVADWPDFEPGEYEIILKSVEIY